LSLIPTLGVKYQVLPSLRTAYDYLNKINLNVGRINLDLLPGDSLNILGSSSVLTNTLLTKTCITSLLPKRYGGFGNSSTVFILDAGNSTDVYQFIEFIRRYGMNIKSTLNRIKISRAFTIYQLTNFILMKYPVLLKSIASI
jgi:Rad51